jgi:hypothetical protein
MIGCFETSLCFVGLGIIWLSASDAYRGASHQQAPSRDVRWRSESLGSEVRLPLVDSRGAAFPAGRSHLMASTPCGGCSRMDILLGELRSVSTSIPLAIVSSLPSVSYSNSLTEMSGIYLFAEVPSNAVPVSFLRYAPQVSRVNAVGLIVEVPQEGEGLAAFIGRHR